ncbi:hypothetical protein EDD22DRAFT_850027 [Suillus occidentalis]|nr:hypothetical protein EDD22DRAFT_850027 [Suillus occidentalis]
MHVSSRALAFHITFPVRSGHPLGAPSYNLNAHHHNSNRAIANYSATQTTSRLTSSDLNLDAAPDPSSGEYLERTGTLKFYELHLIIDLIKEKKFLNRPIKVNEITCNISFRNVAVHTSVKQLFFTSYSSPSYVQPSYELGKYTSG